MKSSLEPLLALASNQDIKKFGDNPVATASIRDMTMLLTMTGNYLMGYPNSATSSKYCDLDLLAGSGKVVFKFGILTPKFISSSISNESFEATARKLNFITEPAILYINKVVKLKGDQNVNGLEFLYNNAALAWIPEVLLGGIARSYTADCVGEVLKYININNNLFKPAYDYIDSKIGYNLCELSSNFTSTDSFLDKMNKQQIPEEGYDLSNIVCKTSLFTTNIAYGFVKEFQGIYIISPITRLSYKGIEALLDFYPELKIPAFLLSSGLFAYSIYGVYSSYYENESEPSIAEKNTDLNLDESSHIMSGEDKIFDNSDEL